MISGCGEGKEGSSPGQDTRSLQQPSIRRGVGTTGVGKLVEMDFEGGA